MGIDKYGHGYRQVWTKGVCMKTIKQIADEIGTTKSAMQKRLARDPLNEVLITHITSIQNTKYIDSTGEELIKKAFGAIDISENVGIDIGTLSIPTSENMGINMGTPSIDTEGELIKERLNDVTQSESAELVHLRSQNIALFEELRTQREDLEREREHSRQQAKSLSELSERLAELTRNSQVLLKQEQDKNIRLLSDGQTSDYPEAEKQAKKSFWKKIFKK